MLSPATFGQVGRIRLPLSVTIGSAEFREAMRSQGRSVGRSIRPLAKTHAGIKIGVKWSMGSRSTSMFRGCIRPDHAQRCTMHNEQCTMHNAQCTMHNSACTFIF